ncbi:MULTISPECIES: tRNA (guanosine(18)-2'-O)-methyltransferase TrmH [Spongiibacter]|jgi:tRNA (guanosine-2'-O-)-methyltransferase|uniref:tRNA (guanosine(18)-2'-O)-methyltransferase TrmH n=1 Tax=Spongiibacter TaxID=630749 RepID=UPI000C0BAA59|nr:MULTISPECIES: tRNA (guanosine(18)-2'-O)-methyltransferase TrmH [unclassified Spongiibacter]MAK43591.1 tRNA (guanosine(18)-2'-O)-methyltransferase TrmH [Spongiibacter sp.]|tara:strand:- start:16956 stop:17639 length:684 start_codon:yes stop_codon:yes gene_type:complete
MTPERYQRLRAVLDRRQPDLTVITDNVHKGRNLSAIVRTADAAGIAEMHAVIDDKDYKAFRGTAMGSHSWVAVRRHRDIAALITGLQGDGYQVLAAHLDADSVDYRQPDYTRPTAILLGAEKRGVSAEACALADAHITIPMMGMVQSYNVSVAAGIILSEAQYQRDQQGLYDRPRLDEQTYRQTLFEWAHPQVRDFCRENGLEYPALREEDGEIAEPAQWYKRIREG